MLALGMAALATPPTFGATAPPPFVTGQPTPVIVENPEDIAKAAGIQQPYVRQGACKFLGSNCTDDSLQILSSQRLVIEFVSGECVIGNVSPLSVSLVVTTSGAIARHHLSVQQTTEPKFSQLVRVYADPSSTLTFSVNAPSATAGSCVWALSGQAVAVP